MREDYGFEDGLFSGYDADKRSYDRASWAYELGADGYALRDDTLQHPRCVFNLLKKHVARYTPEMVSSICGTPKEDFLHVCEKLAATCVPDKTTTILYALGWTQHVGGSQMIRASAIVQLLLGNIGMPGGGINALRGHSNVQGFTDLGVLTTMLPGYLTLPSESQDCPEDLPGAAHPEDPGGQAGELLEEHAQVHGQLPQGHVGGQGHRRKPMGLPLAAQVGSQLRRDGLRRPDDQGPGQRLPRPGLQPDRRGRRLGQGARGAWPSSSTWW